MPMSDNNKHNSPLVGALFITKLLVIQKVIKYNLLNWGFFIICYLVFYIQII